MRAKAEYAILADRAQPRAWEECHALREALRIRARGTAAHHRHMQHNRPR
jgi:hypothetical protein